MYLNHLPVTLQDSFAGISAVRLVYHPDQMVVTQKAPPYWQSL